MHSIPQKINLLGRMYTYAFQSLNERPRECRRMLTGITWSSGWTLKRKQEPAKRYVFRVVFSKLKYWLPNSDCEFVTNLTLCFLIWTSNCQHKRSLQCTTTGPGFAFELLWAIYRKPTLHILHVTVLTAFGLRERNMRLDRHSSRWSLILSSIGLVSHRK